MESNSMRSRAAVPNWLERIDWGSAAVFLLSFGLVGYLGLDGGGYDPLIHDQIGIAIWWLVLAAVAIGAVPRRRLGAPALTAAALLAAFVGWTALSLVWTDGFGNTLGDLARVGGYLGAFALALLARGRDEGRVALGGVAAGIVLVAAVALLSRFHPAWFPEASQTAQVLDSNEERLSYPIHYWNGLAGLVAIGVPLVAMFAASARTLALRALSAAALPLLALTAFLTLSRGGIGAAVLALVVFLVLAADRLPKLATLLVAGAGSALLCLAVASRDALHDGLLNATAERQGDEMIAWTLLVCLAVGAAQLGLAFLGGADRRPAWSRVPRRGAAVATAVGALAVLVALLAVDAPGRAGDAWDEFKQPASPGKGSSRLTSVAGQNRYSYWRSALDEAATKPLTGTGSGTFVLWWTRDRDSGDAVQDAHSLYLQTLGELGVVGLALLLAFLLTVLGAGALATIRAAGTQRSLLAAALAGCLAFWVGATVDWLWQIPALVVAMLLISSVLVLPGRDEGSGAAGLAVPARIGVCLLSLAAIFAIAVPLAMTADLRESEADARGGDLLGALESARSAQAVAPAAAEPRLQEALVLERMGLLTPAAVAAAAAVEREEGNWRNWLVLSRVEAQRGRSRAAVAAYRQARDLNPRSPLFEE